MINISTNNNDKSTIQVSANDDKNKIVEITNNMAKFYAELAKKSENEIKKIILDEKFNSVIKNITNLEKLSEKIKQIDFLNEYIDENNASYQNIINTANHIQEINTISENIDNINQCLSNLDKINASSSNVIEVKKYAIGEPEEPQEHSAKYWAEKAKLYNDSTQDLLENKQDILVSGNNIKTLNNESILGEGNLELKSLPNQEGQAGKFLRTDGNIASWAEVQSSNSTENQKLLFEKTILDYILDDDNYGMADFFEWHDKSTYHKAYNKLVQEYTTGTEQEYKEYTGINATKVGNPNISSDYIVSGFISTSNFLRVANINLGNNFEIQVKVRTGDSMSTTNFVFTGNSIRSIVMCQISENIRNFQYNIGNGSSFIVSDISGTHTITTNTDYWVRMTFNGSVYKAYISTNGKDWAEDWSFTSTNIIPTFTLNIGVGRDTGSPFLGAIDLKECYIKINNVMWWEGCIYKTLIKYNLADNGHFIADVNQEQNIINIYNSTNKAWYYILDQQNERFKLPRSKELLDDINSKTGTTNHLYFYLGKDNS